MAECKCSKCGGSGEINKFSSINVAQNPDLKAKVKDGSLFVWTCPHCGSANLAVFETLYHDPDTKLMVWLLPEGETRAEELASHLQAISDQLPGYTLRRVSTVGELIEKVNVHDDGLDDTVIEMCKYVTKMEMTEKMPKEKAEEIKTAQFRYFKMDGPDNHIILSFPLDGAMQGVNIGFNVYEDCAGIVRRNPDVRPEGAFPKVDYQWLLSKMR